MADEGELAFVATLRDEATREARSAKAQLEALGGDTRPIETPVRIKDQTASGLAAASKRLDEFGSKAIRAGRRMTTGLTLPIVGAGAAAVGLEASYDRTMRQVAIATDAPIGQLDTLAKKLGAETQFSAGEAADAMLELAKGGMTAATIQGGALEQTMRLAAAGGIDLESAATAVSNGLAVFKLNAKDADRVTTSLAGAANASSASVESLTQGLAQSALAAKNSGLSIEETAGALSLFDANGLKGSDAGTSFKTMLSALLPQTKRQKVAMDDLGLSFVDSHGNFDDLGTVAEKLHRTLGPLTQAQRKQALTTIFGSDAFRAASILTDGGRKAVDKYTRAAKDQKTTQELANAAMEGTSGALERAKGSIETAGLAFGETLAPYVEEAAGEVENLANWLSDLDPKTRRVVVTAAALAAALGPAAVGIGAVSRGIGSTLSLVDKLTPSLKTAAAEEGALGAQGDKAAGGVGRMGKAARLAAGAAGIGLLVASSQESSDGLSVLEGALGGAAVGFSAGGPLGAAIGGGIGALGSWQHALDDSAQHARDSIKINKDYADTFDQITGKLTEATSRTVYANLDNTGALSVAKAIGIPDREMIASVMGDVDAMERIKARVDKLTGTRKQLTGPNADLFWFSKESASDFLFSLGQSEKGLSAEQRAFIKTIDAGKSFGQALKGIPKEVRPEVKALGIAPSMKAIKALAREYDLTPKQVRTIVKAIGVDNITRDAHAANKSLGDVGKAKPSTNVWLRALLGDTDAASKLAKRGGLDVQKGLEDGPGKARANLIPWRKVLLGQLAGTEPLAGSAGTHIGQQINSNAMGPLDALAAQAAAAVRRAVAAARAAAGGGGGGKGGGDSSGSGRMAAGSSAGVPTSPFAHDPLERAKSEASKYAHELEDALYAGYAAGLDELQNVLDRAQSKIEAHYAQELKARNKAIEARFKGQKNAAEKIRQAEAEAEQRNDKRRRAALKALREESAAIKAQAVVRAGLAEQLAAAYAQIDPAKFEAMGNDFRDALRSFASITSFTPANDAPVTAGFLQQHLDAQLAKVQAFVANLAALRGKVSDTILKQLEDAGAENGAAYAQALAQATPDQLAAINATQAAIDAATQAAGTEMADHWHEAAVAASAGLIAGLESQLANVDAVGRRLARKLRRAILDELGIKSPSRVLKADMRTGVGGGVVEGVLASIPAAEAAAAQLSARVGAAAQVDASVLAQAVNSNPGISVTSSETITIRHEVTSPDGSLDELTAAQVADLVARDPKSAAALETALRRSRRRSDGRTLSASDSNA